MSRRYAEQIEVRVGEPMAPMTGVPGGRGAVEHGQVPTAFLWRGRLHVVRAVLGCWTQRLPWWRLADWQEEDTPADDAVPPLTEGAAVAHSGGRGVDEHGRRTVSTTVREARPGVKLRGRWRRV
uniref:DUF6504 family protein n=1 Tax=Ornithinicoccus halotolerans TaxID=1748220 RepID=UPI001E53C17D